VTSAHGSARALAQALPGLQVKPERMRANLEAARQQARTRGSGVGDVDWFDLALLDSAAEMATSLVLALRASCKPAPT
jgi:3-carboxy-cis,cis-muconate cycloisomerase